MSISELHRRRAEDPERVPADHHQQLDQFHERVLLRSQRHRPQGHQLLGQLLGPVHLRRPDHGLQEPGKTSAGSQFLPPFDNHSDQPDAQVQGCHLAILHAGCGWLVPATEHDKIFQLPSEVPLVLPASLLRRSLHHW